MSKRDELVEELISSFLENNDDARDTIENNQEVEQAFREFAEASVDEYVVVHKTKMEYAIADGNPTQSVIDVNKEWDTMREVERDARKNLKETERSQGVDVADNDINTRATSHFLEEMGIHVLSMQQDGSINMSSGVSRDQMADKFEAIIEEQQQTGNVVRKEGFKEEIESQPDEEQSTGILQKIKDVAVRIKEMVVDAVEEIKDFINPPPVYPDEIDEKNTRIVKEHDDWMKDRIETKNQTRVSDLENDDMEALNSVTDSLRKATEQNEPIDSSNVTASSPEKTTPSQSR